MSTRGAPDAGNSVSWRVLWQVLGVSCRSSHAPALWVERFAARIVEGGTVLDVASGNGRHARYLRELGFAVVAVDVDVRGLEDVAGDEGIEVIEADLESTDWPLGERRFDGIVVTNYLHRPLLPRLPNMLQPGGVLIYETFARGNENVGRPRNPAFLLEPGELVESFTGRLRIIAYEHGLEEKPIRAVRQRICAISPGRQQERADSSPTLETDRFSDPPPRSAKQASYRDQSEPDRSRRTEAE